MVRRGTLVVHMVMSMVVGHGEHMTAAALPVADPSIVPLALCFLVFFFFFFFLALSRRSSLEPTLLFSGHLS